MDGGDDAAPEAAVAASVSFLEIPHESHRYIRSDDRIHRDCRIP
jgi:hypothetical protein